MREDFWPEATTIQSKLQATVMREDFWPEATTTQSKLQAIRAWGRTSGQR